MLASQPRGPNNHYVTIAVEGTGASFSCNLELKHALKKGRSLKEVINLLKEHAYTHNADGNPTNFEGKLL